MRKVPLINCRFMVKPTKTSVSMESIVGLSDIRYTAKPSMVRLYTVNVRKRFRRICKERLS